MHDFWGAPSSAKQPHKIHNLPAPLTISQNTTSGQVLEFRSRGGSLIRDPSWKLRGVGILLYVELRTGHGIKQVMSCRNLPNMQRRPLCHSLLSSSSLSSSALSVGKMTRRIRVRSGPKISPLSLSPALPLSRTPDAAALRKA